MTPTLRHYIPNSIAHFLHLFNSTNTRHGKEDKDSWVNFCMQRFSHFRRFLATHPVPCSPCTMRKYCSSEVEQLNQTCTYEGSETKREYSYQTSHMFSCFTTLPIPLSTWPPDQKRCYPTLNLERRWTEVTVSTSFWGRTELIMLFIYSFYDSPNIPLAQRYC